MSDPALRIVALDFATRHDESADEALERAAAYLGFLTADAEPATQTATTPAADPVANKRGRGRPPKQVTTAQEREEAEDAVVVEKEAEPTPVEQPPRQEAKPLKSGVSRDAIKLAIETAIKAGIRDDVKRIFGKYGVTNLTGLKEDKYGAFMADLDTAILNA